jgi:hypothetical protein
MSATQPAGGQVAQEREPAGAVFGAGDLQAEDFAVSVGVHAGDSRAWTFTTRPPSRTFNTSASAATNVYGPASSGRVRNEATCS